MSRTAVPALAGRVRAAVPRGGALPPEVAARRRRLLLWVLWAHIPALVAFGLVRGVAPAECAVVVFPAAVLGAAAAWPAFSRPRVRASLTALGLLAASAALVELWDGAIEAHFHFFVMLALVALLQDWAPYGLAIAFVFAHHLVLGQVAAGHVFAHGDAGPGALGWALIHAAFIAAASAASIAAWRYHEDARAEADGRAREQAALRRVAEAVAGGAGDGPLLALIAAEVAGLLGVEVGLVARFDDDGAHLEGAHGLPLGPEAAPIPLTGDGPLARVARGGPAARLAGDVFSSPRARALAQGAGLRDAVVAPVRVGGRLWGAVLAASGRRGAFDPGAAERLTDFAALAALGIENAAGRAELELRATTDPLTGLANHRAFHDRLAEEAGRAGRHRRALSLMLLDLDHFKRVNDAHGHAAGDDVLVQFAACLRAVCRREDLIGRVGGEEFAVLMPETGGRSARVVAERILAAVRETPFGAVGRMTASAGICDMSRARDAEDLARLADGALYWAKAHGRDAAVVYSPEVVQELSAAERAARLDRQRSLASLRALAQAVDAKDRNTRRHSERVADLAVRLATALGWPVTECARLREAGLLHDVGKIGVPDAVLLKPGRLTREEYEQVKLHAALGAQIASEVLDSDQVLWVRHHHERVDGGGYPDGLRQAQLSEGALVMAVADSWDAMTGIRSYRHALGVEDALAECRRQAGRHFAPHVVEALERLAAVGALDPAAAALTATAGSLSP